MNEDPSCRNAGKVKQQWMCVMALASHEIVILCSFIESSVFVFLCVFVLVFYHLTAGEVKEHWVCVMGWWKSWNDPLSGFQRHFSGRSHKQTKWHNQSTRQSENTTSFRPKFSMRTNETFEKYEANAKSLRHSSLSIFAIRDVLIKKFSVVIIKFHVK